MRAFAEILKCNIDAIFRGVLDKCPSCFGEIHHRHGHGPAMMMTHAQDPGVGTFGVLWGGKKHWEEKMSMV